MKKLTTKNTLFTFIGALFLSFNVFAQNTITTDSILQLSTCSGGNILIPFKAVGSYPLGNKFIAQLSDALGQFSDPIDIGQVPFNTGIILGTIPKSANFGFLYKIRVVSTNPVVTGTSCPNTLIITQIAQLNQIIAWPNDTICYNDSVKLTAINIASTYKWSTGDTTQSIVVKTGGVYSVKTKDFLTCESSTSINIVVKSCNSGIADDIIKNNFTIYPNPSSDVIYIKNASAIQKKNYEVFNSIGQVVLQGAVDGDHIRIAELNKGIYFIRVFINQQYYTSKFTKE